MNIKNSLLALLFLCGSSYADFQSLSTELVSKAIKNNMVVIDIRRPDEWKKYGIIPKSHKLTFFDKNGKYDIKKWLKNLGKIVKDKNTPFILVCAHANRTKVVGKFLSSNSVYKNVKELKGGINYGWIDKGLATSRF